jgi:hypothetical protein
MILDNIKLDIEYINNTIKNICIINKEENDSNSDIINLINNDFIILKTIKEYLMNINKQYIQNNDTDKSIEDIYILQIKQMLDSHTSNMESLIKNKSKSLTSAQRGKIGEEIIFNYYSELCKFNNELIIENTAGLTGHGDLSIKYKEIYISIEVKNFTKSIPNKDIEKFNSTMSKDIYNAGIFISINSGFNNKCGIKNLDIVMINNKPTIFLCNITESNKDNLIMCIYMVYNIYKYNKQSNQENDINKYINTLKDNISNLDILVNELNDTKKSISNIENLIKKMKDCIYNTIN